MNERVYIVFDYKLSSLSKYEILVHERRFYSQKAISCPLVYIFICKLNNLLTTFSGSEVLFLRKPYH